jgi:NADPH:quinone reductase-like Zn-dependent oxidoreductase
MKITMSFRIRTFAAVLFVAVMLAAACFDAVAGSCTEPLPDTMRAVTLTRYGGPEALDVGTLPVPTPLPGEVLVRVSAASVNPIDWKLREGMSKSYLERNNPAILGRDAAGVIVALGTDAGAWSCGDQVVAFLDSSRQGGFAEYVPVRLADLVRKPRRLSFRQAAAFPLVAMTAWQSLIDAGRLQSGERVLIHGGAGGVGSMAVQIAKWRGAHVITTASEGNHAYVASIGADQAIDYRAVKFETVVKDVDLVLDTIGGDTLQRSVGVLKKGGRLVSIVEELPAATCSAAGIECIPADVGAAPDTLQKIADLFDAGAITINIDATFPLERAADALEANRTGRTRGKIVLDVRSDAGDGAVVQ